MEYGSWSVKGLQVILNVQCVKNVGCVFYRQVWTVGIERCISFLACRLDIRELCNIMLCQTISRRLSRCCLQIVKITVFFLVIRQALAHMVEDVLGKLLCLFMCQIHAKPLCIESHFVHTNQTDRWKMVVKGSQITLGIWIKTFI